MYIPRQHVEKHWLQSFGEKLDKVHFREPPPGTGHAECDPGSEYCKVHYDKVNPHQDPVGHLVEDSPETLVGLFTASVTGITVYVKRKNVGEALLVSFATGLVSYGLAKLVKSFFES